MWRSEVYNLRSNSFSRLLRLRMPDVIYDNVAGNSPLVYEANENGGPSNYVSRSAKPAKLPVTHV